MSSTKKTARVAVCALALSGMIAGSLPSHAYRMFQNQSTGWKVSGDPVVCNTMNGFVHWTKRTIYFNHNTSGLGWGKRAPLEAAMNAWNGVPSFGHVLAYGGTTNNTFGADGLNTLWWGSDGICDSASCHALTGLVLQSGQVIVESDVLFNANPSLGLDWRTDGVSDPCAPVNPGNRVDTQGIATHEFGHCLGIHHPRSSEPSYATATMGAVSCSAEARSLEADDMEAIQCSEDRYPMNPVYEGVLEVANCRTLSGWGWNANRPNRPIYVHVLKNGSLSNVLPANQFRQDLLNQGKGNGYHGFTYPVGIDFKDAKWYSISTQFSGNGTNLSSSPKSFICAVPIFTTQTPTTFVDTAGQVYTVGTQFSSTHSGYITSLRFWKAPGESGTNTLRLWTDNGTLLASKAASCGSAGTSGSWCTVTLPGNGVPITGSTLYRVSVTTNVKYSETNCGLSSMITNSPLSAWQGFWSTGDTFPNTPSCNNFFVDVKFDI